MEAVGYISRLYSNPVRDLLSKLTTHSPSFQALCRLHVACLASWDEEQDRG